MMSVIYNNNKWEVRGGKKKWRGFLCWLLPMLEWAVFPARRGTFIYSALPARYYDNEVIDQQQQRHIKLYTRFGSNGMSIMVGNFIRCCRYSSTGWTFISAAHAHTQPAAKNRKNNRENITRNSFSFTPLFIVIINVQQSPSIVWSAPHHPGCLNWGVLYLYVR